MGYEQLEVGLSPVGLPSTPDYADAPEPEPLAFVVIGTDAALPDPGEPTWVAAPRA